MVFMNKIRVALLSSAIMVTAGSCSIFNNNLDVEKRLSLYFVANHIAEDIIQNQDTLVIDEFKFSIEKFNLLGNNIELQSSDDIKAFIFSYDQDATNNRLVIDVGLGISDNLGFNGYKMFLNPVPNDAIIIDSDFFGENNNYSLIIKGSLNARNFTYRSSFTFEKELVFGQVSLDDENESLVIIKSIDMEEVFLDENDAIIDPLNSENKEIIESNVRSNLKIEAFASNIF